MKRWEAEQPYSYTYGDSAPTFYPPNSAATRGVPPNQTRDRDDTPGGRRMFGSFNNGGAEGRLSQGGGGASSSFFGMRGGREQVPASSSRQSAASSSSFNPPPEDVSPANRFIGGHGFGDRYDTNPYALEQRRRSQNRGRQHRGRSMNSDGDGSDGDEMMGVTITDATFTHDTERPTERGQHNKIWRKARQQRKLENHILDTTAKYRDRTYGEGGAQSSDDEDHQTSTNKNGKQRAGGGSGGQRRVQMELDEGGDPNSGATSLDEDGDETEISEEDEDGDNNGGDPTDPYHAAKLRRREERRERKERKRTRKLTRLMLQEALGVKRETLKSLKKTQRYVADAEDAGQSAVKSLHNQSEQLGRIDNELDGLAPLMKRAKRDINSIARRMFRDRCFLVLCLLVLVALIVVIVLFARNSILGIARTIGGVIPTVQPTYNPNRNETSSTG